MKSLEQMLELLSRYDGSLEQTVLLIHELRAYPETQQVLFMRLLLSLCELHKVHELDIHESNLPANTFLNFVRIVKNGNPLNGVAGDYRFLAYRHCSDGTDLAPIELSFPTRDGKVLYALVLASCSAELGAGSGFSRDLIHSHNEEQIGAVQTVFTTFFGEKNARRRAVSFNERICAASSDKNFFSRTKCDTNHLISKTMKDENTSLLDDFSTAYIIDGQRGLPRRIAAALDVEGSDPAAIDCLRHYNEVIDATNTFWRKSR